MSKTEERILSENEDNALRTHTLSLCRVLASDVAVCLAVKGDQYSECHVISRETMNGETDEQIMLRILLETTKRILRSVSHGALELKLAPVDPTGSRDADQVREDEGALITAHSGRSH